MAGVAAARAGGAGPIRLRASPACTRGACRHRADGRSQSGAGARRAQSFGRIAARCARGGDRADGVAAIEGKRCRLRRVSVAQGAHQDRIRGRG